MTINEKFEKLVRKHTLLKDKDEAVRNARKTVWNWVYANIEFRKECKNCVPSCSHLTCEICTALFDDVPSLEDCHMQKCPCNRVGYGRVLRRARRIAAGG